MLEIMHIPQKCRGTTQRQQKGANGDSEGVERGVERKLCVARRHLLHYFLPYLPGRGALARIYMHITLCTAFWLANHFVCPFTGNVCVCVCVLCVFALYFSCIIK